MTDVPDPTVEAVAEAIWRAETQGETPYDFSWAELGGLMSNGRKDHYRRLARAAVAALQLTEETAPSMPHWTRLATPWRQRIVDPPEPPEWVTRPVADGTPDIAAMDAEDVAQWQKMERRAAEIARDTFDRGHR